jgi:hypothetical protein
VEVVVVVVDVGSVVVVVVDVGSVVVELDVEDVVELVVVEVVVVGSVEEVVVDESSSPPPASAITAITSPRISAATSPIATFWPVLMPSSSGCWS